MKWIGLALACVAGTSTAQTMTPVDDADGVAVLVGNVFWKQVGEDQAGAEAGEPVAGSEAGKATGLPAPLAPGGRRQAIPAHSTERDA